MHQYVRTPGFVTTVVRRTVMLPLLMVVTWCGCGGQSGPTDEELVSKLVSDLSDATGSPEQFRALFADGAAPDESERQRYLPFRFRTANVEIVDQTATFTVRIRRGRGETVRGEAEWTAVQEDGTWKIKTAPLP